MVVSATLGHQRAKRRLTFRGVRHSAAGRAVAVAPFLPPQNFGHPLSLCESDPLRIVSRERHGATLCY